MTDDLTAAPPVVPGRAGVARLLEHATACARFVRTFVDLGDPAHARDIARRGLTSYELAVAAVLAAEQSDPSQEAAYQRTVTFAPLDPELPEKDRPLDVRLTPVTVAAEDLAALLARLPQITLNRDGTGVPAAYSRTIEALVQAAPYAAVCAANGPNLAALKHDWRQAGRRDLLAPWGEPQ